MRSIIQESSRQDPIFQVRNTWGRKANVVQVPATYPIRADISTSRASLSRSVVFAFQTCPSGKPAVDAPDSFAMQAFPRRFPHEDFPGAVTVNAAGTFAVRAHYPAVLDFIFADSIPLHAYWYVQSTGRPLKIGIGVPDTGGFRSSARRPYPPDRRGSHIS
jgi:hypothetical protein